MKSLLRTIGIIGLILMTGVVRADDRPNILIIFTDDQGYADLGSFGSATNQTPRMDQLAREGTRFTNFYAQTVCGPSRSALLTGRYPDLSKGWGMPAAEITFAELLRDVGYQTACIGKWDVSNRKPIIDRMPNAQGFEYYFGPLGANDHGVVAFHENNEAAGETRDMASLTRLFTDRSIDFLRRDRDPERPFLLYLSHTMMHTVIDASPQFRGTSEGGLYGDVVEEFDFETGRLLDCLEELELAKDTLVIYTTDNGPWCQPNYIALKTGKVPAVSKGKAPAWFMPEGSIFWGDPGPLRGGKGSAYEAGSRVPCIVRWPGRVPAGKVSDAIFATIDFLPTFGRIAGYETPVDRAMDGIDQLDLLMGTSAEGARDQFIYESGHAIRKGPWKLMMPERKPEKFHRYLMDFGTNDYELYNLAEDMGERWNVAELHPNIVRELTFAMEQYQSTLRN